MSKEIKQLKGQASVELILLLGLVLLPTLVAGGYWARSEWNRSKCALEAFKQSRIKLIHTNSPVKITLICGEIKETSSLVPLEDLDTNKGGLEIENLMTEVLQLWGQFFS